MPMPPIWLAYIAEHTNFTIAELSEANQTVEELISAQEDLGVEVFPPADQRYSALELVAPENTSVVIVGQDPYPGVFKNEDGPEVPLATGLSFSIPVGVPLARAKSLQNIFLERQNDLGENFPIPAHGDLTGWANQGVLLLNTVFTVDRDAPNSHRNFGWKLISTAIIRALSVSRPHLVYILWGKPAQRIGNNIHNQGAHTVIRSSHPSWRSCNLGFLGSCPFSRTNDALGGYGSELIDWNV
jgi:uracil-DNA glycosylase